MERGSWCSGGCWRGSSSWHHCGSSWQHCSRRRQHCSRRGQHCSRRGQHCCSAQAPISTGCSATWRTSRTSWSRTPGLCGPPRRCTRVSLATHVSLAEPKKSSDDTSLVTVLCVQVGPLASALADVTGAVMAASRWRVGLAMWCHVIVLVTTLFVLVHFLGNWPGVVSWVLGLAGVVLWWLGVVRDHAKDDVPFLQKHLLLLQQIDSSLSAAAHSCRNEFNIPEDHAVWGTWAMRQEYAELLAGVSEREKRLCRRLRLLPVPPRRSQ